ncbi:MAG: hypothetical protein COA94_04095 [Rickettsiales bacterium]|nr:MAG: hypothetical protein COA94_04095 [Rickettsiales bacterium]
MMRKRTILAFFAYSFCVVAYFVPIFANSIFIEGYLSRQSINFIEHDQIDAMHIYGYVVATILLLVFFRYVAFKKLITFSVFLYILSTFAIVLAPLNEGVSWSWFFLHSASLIITPILMLWYILCDDKINNNYSIAIYFSSILTAYLVVELVGYFIIYNQADFPLEGMVVSNLIPFGVFGSILGLSAVYEARIDGDDEQFYSIMRNMEIESLVGFTVFYVLILMLRGYDLYALINHLVILEVRDIQFIMFIAMVIAIGVTIFLPFQVGEQKFNRHKLSISCIALMMILFTTLPYWGLYYITDIVCWFILGVLFYLLFSFHLLILSEKFDGINLFTALAIYALICCFGCYSGYLVGASSENTIGENGFLISISFVLLGLLLYYMYFSKKHKLYK